jgi:hypothetical protein
MGSVTKSNADEQMILDTLCSHGGALVVRKGHPGSGGSLGGESGKGRR